jgi:PAS domain S-box-containing protein
MDEYFNTDEKVELKVLYVEDEVTIREAVTELLSRRISRLFTASNGKEGLEIFQKEHPEIVITDIRMPEMNGLEMSRLIKQSDPSTKIIITSAHSDSNYFIEAITIGVNEYVLKPISRDKLFEALYNSARGIFMQRKLDRQWQTISKLYGAIEQSQSLVIITDKNRKIEYVNTRFTEVTGFTADEVIGSDTEVNIEYLCDIENNPGLKKVFETHGQWRGEYTIRHKNNEPVWLFGSLTPVLDNNSDVTSFVKVGEDISEIRQLAATLADREDKLRNLIEKLGEGIAILDLTYDFVFCNVAMEEIFESQELKEQNISSYVVSHGEMQKVMNISRELKVGEKAHLEMPIISGAGNEKHLSVTLTPQLDNKGLGITGLFCIFKDITRMKQLIDEIKTARDAAEKAYQTIEEKNLELGETNQKLQQSEKKLSEMNEILMEYIKATGK